MERKDWENGLKQIFKDIFLDQLHKESRNFEAEVDQVRCYLNTHEPEHVLEVKNFDQFKLCLNLSESDIATIRERCGDNKRQVTLEMARLFARRADSSITDEGNVTTSHQQWSEYAEAQSKNPPSRRQTTFRTPKQVGFPQTYMRPSVGFQKTVHFDELESLILKRKNKVTHVYGMSGSGKSELVRGLCSKIEDENEDYVIWHIQCPQKQEKLKKGLQDLLSCLKRYYPEIRQRDLLPDKDTKHFVEALAKMKFRILMVFEDSVEQQDQDLVRDLIQNILFDRGDNIQLIIVTPSSEAFYPDGNGPTNDTDYMLYRVTGFTEMEAVTFLCGAGCHDEAASKLAAELSYSPLRLSLVKIYCRKKCATFDYYYQNLGKNETIIEEEKRVLRQYPHLGKHTYEIVVKMMQATDKDEKYQIQVLKMMSFVNDVSIPDLLIRKFLKEACPDSCDVDTELIRLNYFMKRLEKEFMASTRLFQDGRKIISAIHKDILTAIRFSMDISERKEIIVKILSMVIVIGKDNRNSKDNTLLSDMMSHLNIVMEFAENLLRDDLESTGSSRHNFDILLCLSRLCEVVGFATSQGSSKTDDSRFDKSIKYLLKIPRYYLEFTDVHRASTIESILNYIKGKDSMSTAKELYEVFKQLVRRISTKWITDANYTFSPLTPQYIKDMKDRWPKLQWDAIERKIQSEIPLDVQDEWELQNVGALLEPRIIKKVFFAEYLASILHSRGRQMFYEKVTMSNEDREHYEWYADVGMSLCQLIDEDTGVKSSFLYIIEANNILHRYLVPPLNLESDQDFARRLDQAREVAKKVLAEDGDFYEHGKYKRVCDNAFSKFNGWKIIVQANTKIYKRKHLVPSFKDGQEQSYCKKLYDIAKKHASQWPVASNCLIYVAKYLGATGEFEKAMEAIELGFAGHINKQRDIKVETYCWALYNSGRVLYASRGNMESFQNHYSKFFNRRKSLLGHKSEEIPQSWQDNIAFVAEKLESIAGVDIKRKATGIDLGSK